jgi:hypothetical protein
MKPMGTRFQGPACQPGLEAPTTAQVPNGLPHDPDAEKKYQ